VAFDDLFDNNFLDDLFSQHDSLLVVCAGIQRFRRFIVIFDNAEGQGCDSFDSVTVEAVGFHPEGTRKLVRAWQSSSGVIGMLIVLEIAPDITTVLAAIM